MSEHLDRARPLWTFDLIGPLDDGREAIALRIHHAMADGIAAVRFLDAVLWDFARAGRHARPPAGASPRRRHHLALAEAVRMPGAVLPRTRPPRLARRRSTARSQPRGHWPSRCAPLAELKAIGASRPTHATVNDVLLAIVAGGLRAWLGVGAAVRHRICMRRCRSACTTATRAQAPSATATRSSTSICHSARRTRWCDST